MLRDILIYYELLCNTCICILEYVLSKIAIITCISCLCCATPTYRILYCNQRWYVRKGCGKYTILRLTSNNHGIVANIISTSGERVWRWI